MTHPLVRARGVLRAVHDEVVDLQVDFTAFDAASVPEALRARAQRVWQERTQTEFRSVQLMTRFLHDVLAAGDPLDVYGAAADLIRDEIRHVTLCAEMTRALGATPALPEPLEVKQSPQFLALSAADRALATAIGMLAVNETLSVGFIQDLHRRCAHPVVKAVLGATVEDEEGHEALGWEYIRASLERFPPERRGPWRDVAAQALRPQLTRMEEILRGVPPAQRRLEDWPEPELVDLGLFGPQRQALVLEHTLRTVLEPRLAELDLLPA